MCIRDSLHYCLKGEDLVSVSGLTLAVEYIRSGLTLEQQPPKMSATVTPQLIRAGKMVWIVAAVTPMALEKVKGASGSMPGFAVSSRGPALICLVPGGTWVSTGIGVPLRRRALLACANELAGLEDFMLWDLELRDTMITQAFEGGFGFGR